MAVQLLLLGLVELAIRIDVGCVLDRVLGVRDLQRLPVAVPRICEWNQIHPRSEESGLDRNPLRLVGGVVEIHLLERTDLVTITAVDVTAAQCHQVVNVHGCHGCSLRLLVSFSALSTGRRRASVLATGVESPP